MRCLKAVPMIALLLACGGLAAQESPPAAGGWADYTLGPPLELTQQSTINKRGHIILETDVRLDNIIAVKSGLWAVISRKNEFAHWADGAWHTVSGPEPLPKKANIIDATKGPDGAACFRWFSGDSSGIKCTLFRGGQWRILAEPRAAQGAGTQAPIRVMADTQSHVWCDQAELFGDQPGWKEVAEIQADSSLAPLMHAWGLGTRYMHYDKFYLLDKLDRIWCFTAEPGNPEGFPPVVIIEPNPARAEKPAVQDSDWGRAFAVVDTKGNWLTDKQDTPPQAKYLNKFPAQVVPRSDNLSWVILYGRQLWEVDTATLKGRLVWKGANDRAPWIDEMFALGDSWYAVGSGNLHRLSNGQLEPVFPDSCEYFPPHPAINEEGAWFVGGPAHLWFLPKNGGPFRPVDRQSGVMLDDSYGVAVLPSGEAVAWAHGGGVAPLPKAADISPKPPLLTHPAGGTAGQIPPDPATGSPGCGWIQFSPPSVRSSAGNIYGFTSDRSERRLARWDGTRWSYLSLPERFSEKGRRGIIEMDASGILWIFGPQESGGKQACMKFLPDEERWQEFEDLEKLIPSLRPGEMVLSVYGQARFVPVRTMEGATLRITDKYASVFANGEWKHWTIAELWDVLARSSPVGNIPSAPNRFDDATVAVRRDEQSLAIRLSSGSTLVLKDGKWTQLPSSEITSLYGFPVSSQAEVPDNDKDPGMQWRTQLECAYELEGGRLYRTFRGGKAAVFADMPVTPLPTSETALTANIGPGNWPLFSLSSGLLFVLLDPVVPRPEASVETVKGNHIRISVNSLPAGVQPFWREGWPDDKHRTATWGGKGGKIKEEKPDEWKPVEETGTELGPFEDGLRIIEVVAADGQQHTSETLRAVIKIEAPADSIAQWAREVADAWPNPAPDAEASLRKKGRAGLDELRGMVDKVASEKAPALRRMVQILDADAYVPAPDPPVAFPELPADTGSKMEQTGSSLVQDTEGWIWRVESQNSRNYSVFAWTGQRWLARPTTWTGGNWPILSVDSARRVWLTNESAEVTVRVFSPLDGQPLGEGTWRDHDSLQSALDAYWIPSLQFSHAPAGQSRMISPLSSLVGCAAGDLAFVTMDALHARIGGKWRRWGAAELPGMLDLSTSQWRLRFDAENRLVVKRRQDTLRLETSGKWAVQTEGMKVPADSASASPLCESVWGMQSDGLCCTSFGVTALVVPKADLPSGYPSKVMNVLLDPSGTMFAQSAPDGRSYMRFHCPAAPPKTSAKFAVADNGVRVIRVEKVDETVRHAWRVDEGPWQDAVADAEIALTPLPAGPHTVDVCAVNAAALPDPSPVRLAFEVAQSEIKVPEPVNPGALLKQLQEGSTEEKEQAAKALIDLSESVLPKLKTLLQETKDEGAHWRIEAVIQQIEGKAGAAATE